MKNIILLMALISISTIAQAKDCTLKIEKQISRMDQGTIFDFDQSEEQPEDKTLQSFRVAVSCHLDHREGMKVYDVTVNGECSVINVEMRMSPNCHQ